MTNFQASDGRPRLITPERLVLLLPIAAGAALLALVLVLGYPPLLLQLQQRRTAIAELQEQEAMLPLLRSQLNASAEQQERRTKQQARLLTLVAGTGELRTWLASINDLAAAAGVAITQVQPGEVERYTPPPTPPPEGTTPDPAQAAVPAEPAKPADPLLAPKLEKRSAQITVRGSYPALRTFLQRLEALQVVAIASELELKAEPPAQQAAQGQPAGPALTALTLKLSAYGRAPAQP